MYYYYSRVKSKLAACLRTQLDGKGVLWSTFVKETCFIVADAERTTCYVNSNLLLLAFGWTGVYVPAHCNISTT
jgi:hypothetical protein